MRPISYARHQSPPTVFRYAVELTPPSGVLAGEKLGIKKVDDGIWIVSFMHYDLGFIDLEQKTLQPLERDRQLYGSSRSIGELNKR